MDEKKQIKEMAEVICGSGMVDTYSRCEIIAEELYIADYRKQSGWISVDERLPDCGGRFLTIDTEGRVSVDSYYAGMGWFCPSCNANDITHWMPLPERPKGE